MPVTRTNIVAAATAGGNQDIEIGSLGQPEAFWIFVTRAIAADTYADGAYMGFCCGDGTNYWGQACASEGGGIASSNTKRAAFHDGTATTPVALELLDASLAADGAFYIAPRASWPTNGIRLVWRTAPAVAYRLHVVFWDVANAKVGTFSRNNTQNSSTTISPGFQAELMVFNSLKGAISSGGTWTDGAFFGFGCASYNGSGIDQRGLWHKEDDASATTSTTAEACNDRCLHTNTLGGNDDAIEITDMRNGGSSDDVLATSRDQAGNDLCGYLALKMPTGIGQSLFSFSTPTSTGNHDVTGSLGGATPDFAFLAQVAPIAYNTPLSGTVSSELLAFSMVMAAQQSCVAYGVSQATADAYRKSLSTAQAVKAISMDNADTPVVSFDATLTGFIADGVRLNYGTTNGTARAQWGFVIELSGTVPDAPTSLVATAAGAAQIGLAWDAPADDGGATIDAYQIERESPVGGGFSVLVGTTGNDDVTFTDTTCLPGTEYNYRVSAINIYGTGAASNEADDTTDAATAPDPPTSPSAVGESPTSIILDWVAPVDDGGSAITGYQIERESPIGGGFSVLVADTGNALTTYRDAGLTSGTEYNYRISAINAIDTGTASAEADDTTPAYADNDQLSILGLLQWWSPSLPRASGDVLDRPDRQHLLSLPRTTLFDTLNLPPIAYAGPDQASAYGRTIQLDFTGSSDPEGDTLTYLAEITLAPDGSVAELSSTTAAQPTFLPDLAGLYRISLVVSDGVNFSAPDTVDLTVVDRGDLVPMFIAASRVPWVFGVNRKLAAALTAIPIDVVWKYPNDLYDVAVNWEGGQVMPAGAVSLGALTVVVKNDVGAPVTSSLLVDSGVEGLVAWAEIQGGTIGKIYDVIFTQTFDTGEVLEKYVKIEIRNPRNYVTPEIFKYPNDAFPVTIQWDGRMPRGVPAPTLTSVVTKALTAIDGDESSTYIDSSYVAKKISASNVKAGTAGDSRMLEVAATFSNGRKFHEYALLTVRTPPA